jgi:AcrR family transcriptional regulator
MTERPSRPYSSQLRDDQAQRTRDLILDALTELLSDQPAHEITTRAIAERAGVSQPTVYRHFPDRQALLEGLSDRITAIAAASGANLDRATTLDELVANAAKDLAITDEHAVLATAEAILNADPRRLSRASRARSDALRRMVAEELPDYDERDHVRITALLRCLFSVQNWLRMREEFGVPGTESGPVLVWAVDVLLKEIRAGNFPHNEPAT